MKDELNLKQGISLLMLYIYGSAIIFGLGAQAGRDAWLAVLIAFGAALVMVMIYIKILTLFPDKNLFAVFELVLGRFLGKLVSLFYIFFTFYLGSLVLRNFGQFLITVNYPETPVSFIIIFMIFLCIWVLKAGVEILGRSSELMAFLIIILTLVAIFLPTGEMKLEKIMPILGNGWKPVLQGAFGAFAFPFGETVVLTLVFDLLKNSQKIAKAYWGGFLIGGLIICGAVLAELLFIGEMEYTVTYFPSYKTLSLISYGVIERVEVIAASLFFSAAFCKISLCLFGACRGIAQVFELSNYRVVVIPVAFLMVILAIIVFDSTMEMFENLKFWNYLALPFEAFIPMIFLLLALFRKKQLHQLKEE